MTFAPMLAARALIDARKKGCRLEKLPKELQPISEAEACAIQDAVAKTLGPVFAWKVGSATAESEPFRAPISVQFGPAWARSARFQASLNYLRILRTDQTMVRLSDPSCENVACNEWHRLPFRDRY